MKIILVPTDFSIAADNALEYAIPIAKKLQAKISLVHAFNVGHLYPAHGYPLQFIEKETADTERRANGHLSGKCTQIKTRENIDCEYVSLLGQPREVILKVAKDRKPAMIVMGTNGANAFLKKILGSTASMVIANVPCPVLAVPANAKYHAIDKIAYPTSLHQKDIKIFNKARDLQLLDGGHVSLVNILDTPNAGRQKERMEALKEKLAKDFPEMQFTARSIGNKTVDEGLLSLAGNRRYDLLVMAVRDRSFLESLINENVTRKVAGNIKIPLLTIRA